MPLASTMPLASPAALVRELSDAPDAAGLAAILGRAAVPALGDIATLYVLDQADTLRPVLPAGVPLASALSSVYEYERRPDRRLPGYHRVMHVGRCVTLADLSVASSGLLAEQPDHRALLEAAGFRSLLLAPLIGRGRAVGLLVVGAIGAPRHYGADALALAELLAAAATSSLAARDLERRESASRARLEDMVLAARELAHLLNNDLTLPVGAVEILLDRADPNDDLHEMLKAAAADLAAAECHIHAFHRRVRGETPAPPGATPGPTPSPGEHADSL
jgi:GAF domain-containing protein